MIKNGIALTLLLLLSACGFHLVGAMDLPPQLDPIYIESSLTYSPIVNGLKSSLESAGVTLTDTAADAHYIINISREQTKHELIGSAATQETRKYTLIYEVTFAINNPLGKPVYGPHTLRSDAALYVYSGQVLGNNNETAPAINQLQRETIQKMMLQLSSQEAHNALLPTDTEHENITSTVPATSEK
jgi:LPS-assembly lipoprotein